MNFQMTPRDRRATSSIGKRDRVPKRFRPIFGLGDANVLARMVTRNLEVDGGPGLPRGSGFCCLGDREGGREGGSCREREREIVISTPCLVVPNRPVRAWGSAPGFLLRGEHSP